MSVIVKNDDGTTTTLSDVDFAATNISYTDAELFDIIVDNLNARLLAQRAAFTWFGLAIPLDDVKLAEIFRVAIMLETIASGYQTYDTAGAQTAHAGVDLGLILRYQTGTSTFASGPGFTFGNALDLNTAAHTFDFQNTNVRAGKQDDLDTAFGGSDRTAMLAVLTDIDSDWIAGT